MDTRLMPAPLTGNNVTGVHALVTCTMAVVGALALVFQSTVPATHTTTRAFITETNLMQYPDGFTNNPPFP